MKILIQIERFDTARGGAEAYTALLCNDLVKHGARIEIQTMSWRNPPPGVRMVHVPVGGGARWQKWLSFLAEADRLTRKSDADRVLGINLGTALDIFQPHSGTIPGGQRQNIFRQTSPALRLMKRLEYLFAPKAATARRIDRNIYRSGARVIALSRMVARDMKTYYRIPDNRISLVYNGVDTFRFHPEKNSGLREAVRRKWGIPEKTTVFSLVAHNFSLKGVDAFLKALSRLEEKNVVGIVAGRGKTRKFHHMARRLGISGRVLFTGPVEQPEEIYAASDAYIHPTWYDPCSLVVLEAMATGLPVVTTRLNGAGELLREGVSGFLVNDPRAVRELTDAMKTLLDPDIRREMGKKARAAAEKNSWEHHFGHMRRLIFSSAQ